MENLFVMDDLENHNLIIYDEDLDDLKKAGVEIGKRIFN